MNKEELLKKIMKLPKVETINSISTMNAINVDDLMSAVDRFDKVPDYNDLLEENKELKKQVELEVKVRDDIHWYLTGIIDNLSEINQKLIGQQKEFIKWLEDMLDHENNTVVRVKDVLQRYKEIIGESDENNKQ